VTASLVLHGHFYQPPRGDPWTGEIPRQPNAAPWHDWNERIAEECYDPLGRAEAFAWLSFDVGPTLLRWLERARPDTYASVLRGDSASRARTGHGNAIAQPYHHVILPLASRREKRRELRWGMLDFERRFGRSSEGMWLPETAVDQETLEVLAELGIAFTILAPRQVVAPPPAGRPGRVRVGGRDLAVFVYDGDLSHGVAFGELLRDPAVWERRIETAGASPGSLVSLAMDGETFGHHHKGAVETLAAVLGRQRSEGGRRVENFASFLARNPPVHEVEIVSPSSWSCPHGVDRWRTDCGCRMSPADDLDLSWRAPLRDALETLRNGLEALYDERGPATFVDADAAREGYGAVLDSGADRAPAYLESAVRGPDLTVVGSTLLEMIRDAGAMFTSCGWFFDDVSGLEPTQLLRHAAHAIDLAGRLDPGRAVRLERELAGALAAARSNDPEVGDAARLYEREVRGPHPLGVAAGWGAPIDA